MRIAPLALTMAATMTLAGCGNWNPLGWMRSSSSAPTSLAPEGGYPQTRREASDLVPQIVSATYQPINDGRLLVVTAMAPTKGWHDLALMTARPQPEGQLRPDDDGILRLVLTGLPPLEGSVDARTPATLEADLMTVAMPVSHLQLSRIRGVEISAANNVVNLR
ncbi:MAG: hypothetical protein Q4G36_06800 [Paracoccus sp. (in: a-proteobacteria)]|nr:hypothetical protein [Paracoccus sp. (in: a-proteobacteria)]